MTHSLILLQTKIKENMKTIERLVDSMNDPSTSIVEILRQEIKKLRSLNEQYSEMVTNKRVVHTDRMKHKTKYFLKDGSSYVVYNDSKVKYLYDAENKSITYQFENGQVERTINGVLREIRYPDGSIVIKYCDKDCDYYK